MLYRTLVLTLILSYLCTFNLSHGWIITRAIDAQKALIAREEALFEQAKTAVKDRTDNAVNSVKEGLLNVAEQIHYYVTFPVRLGDQVMQRSRGMLDNARTIVRHYISTNPIPQSTGTDRGWQEKNNATILQRIQEQLSDAPILRIALNTSSDALSEERSYGVITNNTGAD
ncbi:uncharacterized protein LOC131691679 [Topomyia yanbarensis]|uniref:uncharacterized protein LOC131691679 n=1 Tax=Topomyia yanbarensis TaxID=2498891 RepID=UPI00273BF4F4|nr:uncharacterized protein LOC131691679 [Topomyia yanbarensis]